MKITATVDRIEGALAVLEIAGDTYDWPLSALPPESVEGSTLTVVFKLTGPSSRKGEASARQQRLAARNADSTSDVIDL